MLTKCYPEPLVPFVDLGVLPISGQLVEVCWKEPEVLLKSGRNNRAGVDAGQVVIDGYKRWQGDASTLYMIHNPHNKGLSDRRTHSPNIHQRLKSLNRGYKTHLGVQSVYLTREKRELRLFAQACSFR